MLYASSLNELMPFTVSQIEWTSKIRRRMRKQEPQDLGREGAVFR